MVLHIDGLGDTSQRNLCEEALLKIRVFLALLFKWLFKDANPLGFEIRGSGVNDSINRGYKGSASGEKWEWRRDAGPIPGYGCKSRTEHKVIQLTMCLRMRAPQRSRTKQCSRSAPTQRVELADN